LVFHAQTCSHHNMYFGVIKLQTQDQGSSGPFHEFG